MPCQEKFFLLKFSCTAHSPRINIPKGELMKKKNPKKTASKTRKPRKVSRRKAVKRGRKPGRKGTRKPKATTAEKKQIARLTARLKKARRAAKAVVKMGLSIQKDLAFVMSK